MEISNAVIDGTGFAQKFAPVVSVKNEKQGKSGIDALMPGKLTIEEERGTRENYESASKRMLEEIQSGGLDGFVEKTQKQQQQILEDAQTILDEINYSTEIESMMLKMDESMAGQGIDDYKTAMATSGKMDLLKKSEILKASEYNLDQIKESIEEEAEGTDGDSKVEEKDIEYVDLDKDGVISDEEKAVALAKAELEAKMNAGSSEDGSSEDGAKVSVDDSGRIAVDIMV